MRSKIIQSLKIYRNKIEKVAEKNKLSGGQAHFILFIISNQPKGSTLSIESFHLVTIQEIFVHSLTFDDTGIHKSEAGQGILGIQGILVKTTVLAPVLGGAAYRTAFFVIGKVIYYITKFYNITSNLTS